MITDKLCKQIAMNAYSDGGTSVFSSLRLAFAGNIEIERILNIAQEAFDEINDERDQKINDL